MDVKNIKLSAEEEANIFSQITRRHISLQKKYRLILLLILITLISYFYMLIRGPLFNAKSKVPNLIGKEIKEAKEIAINNKLEIKVVQSEYRFDVPKGKIIRQRPISGEYIAKNGFIEIALSLGKKQKPNPDLIKVPNIEGMSYKKAISVLKKAGLSIQKGPPQNSMIIIQSPQPWERATKGSVVNVIVDQPFKVASLPKPNKPKKAANNEYKKTTAAKIKVIRRGNPFLKRVALTLDDGWNYDPRVLDLLETYNLKITVFIIGGRGVANENPDFISRMDQAGFEISTHTFSHYYLSNFSDKWIKKDIQKGQEVITAITNKKFPYMRPSGGYIDQRTSKIVNDLGYNVILWSADLGDTNPTLTNEERKNRVLNKLENGTIIVGHFGGYGTYETLKELIPEILKRGYEITTITRVIEGIG